MKVKEAIKYIDDVLSSEYHYDETLGYELTSDDIEWLEMAKEALEKQVPKKVDIPQWSPAKCPNCGRELSVSLGGGYYQHPTFLEVCPNVECCQRLKWY